MVVEAPPPDVLAQLHRFGHALGIGQLGEHAVEGRQRFVQAFPALPAAAPHARATALHQQRAAAQERPGPDALGLDLRLQIEHRLAGHGQPQVDGIPERLGGEAQPQRHRLRARRALHRNLALAHAPVDLLGAGP